MSYRPLLGCVWASILLAVAAFRIGAFLWVWLPTTAPRRFRLVAVQLSSGGDFSCDNVAVIVINRAASCPAVLGVPANHAV